MYQFGLHEREKVELRHKISVVEGILSAYAASSGGKLTIAFAPCPRIRRISPLRLQEPLSVVFSNYSATTPAGVD